MNRRQFLRASGAAAVAAAALTGGRGRALALAKRAAARGPASAGRGIQKVIMIAMDGMDPLLVEDMMSKGQLPNFTRLRQQGGYRRLGTTVPPQTVVAFATMINGANPGTHGIYDFIQRDPHEQFSPEFSAARTVPGERGWVIGDYSIPLTFWPFDQHPAETKLLRRGVPFWDYLDDAGIAAWIYSMPSNYPPSPSVHGHQRALAGLGTPDMLGTYGTYQHFAQNGPYRPDDKGGGWHSRVRFTHDSAKATLFGPDNRYLRKPRPVELEFVIHRDLDSRAAVIEIQDHRIMLRAGEWSRWVRLDFRLAMPSFMPDQHLSGICRFYLQEVGPNFRLYVTPINIDPARPSVRVSEPPELIEQVSGELGLFYTAGFQEDHKALSNGAFNDEEFAVQAGMVMDERLALLQYALRHYDDGFLFFYFASTDLQAHMFWWDSQEKHPVRSPEDATRGHDRVKKLYQQLDGVVGEVLARYGDQATVLVMSDHGFANFKRQFNLNRWLRDNGYIQPADCENLLGTVDWSGTTAYGLGLNGLYLNLTGRERDGSVDPGPQREGLVRELTEKLEGVRDEDGQPVIAKVYRTDQIYHGSETHRAPDLIVGYHRRYRCSWATSLGDMAEEVLSDNQEAWAADHCIAAEQIPGVLLCNRPIRAADPHLVDLAPTILGEFGLATPGTMEGKNVLGS